MLPKTANCTLKQPLLIVLVLKKYSSTEWWSQDLPSSHFVLSITYACKSIDLKKLNSEQICRIQETGKHGNLRDASGSKSSQADYMKICHEGR